MNPMRLITQKVLYSDRSITAGSTRATRITAGMAATNATSNTAAPGIANIPTSLSPPLQHRVIKQAIESNASQQQRYCSEEQR
jgi:hypothetical protein